MTIASLIRALFGIYSKPAEPGGKWFPMKAAVALLAFYAALHLAVGGILHLVNGDIPFLSLLAGATSTE
jgi:hypothetical protein